MTHSHSDPLNPPRPRRAVFAAVAIIAVLAPLIPIVGALVTTDRYIVREEEPVTEDQIVASSSALIEGTLDGNLTVFSGDVTVSGTITGDVTAISGGTVTVTSTGTIEGSLQGVAVATSIQGTIGKDLFITGGSVVVEESGRIGRDAIGFGGTVRIEGDVGRDVRGRSFRTTVDGRVGGDVDVASQSLSIGPSAQIGGDLLYRSPAEADVAEGAEIAGTVTRLPTQGNFIFALILTVANIVGFLGFLVVGLLTLWIIRGTASRAVGAVLTSPIKSFFVGLATVIVFPLVVAFVAVTLVGLPLAVVLGAIGLIGVVLGPVPAVTALGNRVLFGRGGLFVAFLVGAILWRLGIWLIPYVGAVLFVVGLTWGVGAWVMGALASRRAEPIPPMLLPPEILDTEDAPTAWEPPKAPAPPTAASPTEADAAKPLPADDRPPVITAEDVPQPPPDPAAQRDESHHEDPVTFDQTAASDEASSTDTEDDLSEGAGDPDDDPVTRRFRELREEFRAKGDVAPPSPSDDEPPSDGDDWGLPQR